MSDAVLKWVERWWRSLLPHAPTQQRSLQALILNLLCLRLCEQNRRITRQQWRSLLDNAEPYRQLCQLLQSIHDQYGALVLTPELWPIFPIKDDLLHQLVEELEELCGEKAIAPTLLGQAYEQCLSHPNIPTSSPAPPPSNRKTSGSYYTPSPIVDYIIHSTLPSYSPLPAPSSPTPNTIRLSATRLSRSPKSHAEAQHPTPNTQQLLDPACGGGIFLLTAYQHLLNQQLQHYLADDPEQWAQPQGNGLSPLVKKLDGNWQLSRSERERILLHSIYGVDIDPGAIAVTRLALRFKLLETESLLPSFPLLDRLPDRLPDLSHSILRGNALIGSDFYAATTKLNSSPDDIVAFDWYQAFPKIMAAGGFDVVLGNPPYVDAEGMTVHLQKWRTYCTTRYKTASGNWDLFCVFIEKALQLCRPGGLVSFVVPNKLASANYAAKARSLLIHENQLLSIRDYSQIPIFSVAVYPLVFVVNKGAPDRHATIRHEVMGRLSEQTIQGARSEERSPSVYEHHSIHYSRYLANPEAPWLLSSSPHHADLVERLRQSFPALGALALVTGAATVAEAYTLQPLIHNNPAPENGDLQLVNSGTIDRYRLRWGEKRLRYLGKTYQHPIIPRSHLHHLSSMRQQQATQPKIIVAGMSKVLECGLDSQGTVLAGKSTSVIRVAANGQALDLRYLLGLLNSRLIHLYFSNNFGGNRLQGGYLRVGPPQLRQIPICLPNAGDSGDRHHVDQIIEAVEQILSLQRQVSTLDSIKQAEAHRQIHRLDEQIDKAVYFLYRLTDHDIERLRNENK